MTPDRSGARRRYAVFRFTVQGQAHGQEAALKDGSDLLGKCGSDRCYRALPGAHKTALQGGLSAPPLRAVSFDTLSVPPPYVLVILLGIIRSEAI